MQYLFTMAYLPLVNYKGNISQIVSIGFSPVQIVLLWVLFYLLLRCLLLSGATDLIYQFNVQSILCFNYVYAPLITCLLFNVMLCKMTCLMLYIISFFYCDNYYLYCITMDWESEIKMYYYIINNKEYT